LVLQDSWGLGVGLTTPPHKTIIITKPSKEICEGGQSPHQAVALRKKKNCKECNKILKVKNNNSTENYKRHRTPNWR
jgi:hypothetical protein